MLTRNTHSVIRQAGRLARSGFTLMEVLVVVAIIVVLAGVGTVSYMSIFGESKEKVARHQIAELTTAARTYKLNNGQFPPSLADLTRPQPNGGRKLIDTDALTDPWGKPYQYSPQGPRNNDGEKPDIWTISGEGSGKEIGNWPAGH
jgi:general secretion pathway protein G